MHIDMPARKASMISLTPLIDVVFILLVFFMLATRFIDLAHQPLTVAVGSTASDPATTVLRITVLGNNRIDIDGKRYRLDRAEQHLKTLTAVPVYVISDNDASLQSVLNVTDMLQRSGLHDVHLDLLP
ncbi:MAG: hypothetical protein CVV10_04940 [Gammaproteobacteria bacterium HGW-Gammaproteobacteria-14]|nr:MAG: hypothetical protein CVV10_04940 [Gammaproteobacteria bacterium HGW-Gammaproteobacteria-14]